MIELLLEYFSKFFFSSSFILCLFSVALKRHWVTKHWYGYSVFYTFSLPIMKFSCHCYRSMRNFFFFHLKKINSNQQRKCKTIQIKWNTITLTWRSGHTIKLHYAEKNCWKESGINHVRMIEKYHSNLLGKYLAKIAITT